MRRLYPSFADPRKWRAEGERLSVSRPEWRRLRGSVLLLDNFSCRYCGFTAVKYQIVHHIDGDPENDGVGNLETVCPMCNLIHHAGQGCVVQEVVDLYENSAYSQEDVIQITRRMRAEGKADSEIIEKLGLSGRKPFRMDKTYLRQLYGFVTSRKPAQKSTEQALDYGYRLVREEIAEQRKHQKTLSSFMQT